MATKKIILYLSAAVLIVFALMTLYMGGSVIFNLFGVRAKVGHYVTSVVVANFIAAILYLFAVYYMLRGSKMAFKILMIASAILILAFIVFILHVSGGGEYEERTFIALPVRTGITIFFAGLTRYLTLSPQSKK